MRLNRFIASATGLSRRAADQAIQAGRVRIGERVATLGEQVEEGSDVWLDDQTLTTRAGQTIALHKPVGYICSREQQGNTPTIYALLPAKLHHLKPVGRLDKDSSGILLLSSDGELAHRLTHPKFEKPKLYRLRLNRPPSADDLARLKAGVELDDGPSRAEVARAAGTQVWLKIKEGRNRQLRRTLEALGYAVKELERLEFGPYSLDDLPSGQYRTLEPTP